MALGYSTDDCVVYDPSLPEGGLSADDVNRAKFILWKGHCYVHQRFTVGHIQAIRAKCADISVIVHPECPREVVAAADAAGSTEQIIRVIDAAPAGSKWAIGTESNLVDRLARRHANKLIRVLSDAPATCTQMGRIDLPHLCWLLDSIAAGRAVNRITVDPAVADDARAALRRMIDITADSGHTGDEPPA